MVVQGDPSLVDIKESYNFVQYSEVSLSQGCLRIETTFNWEHVLYIPQGCQLYWQLQLIHLPIFQRGANHQRWQHPENRTNQAVKKDPDLLPVPESVWGWDVTGSVGSTEGGRLVGSTEGGRLVGSTEGGGGQEVVSMGIVVSGMTFIVGRPGYTAST